MKRKRLWICLLLLCLLCLLAVTAAGCGGDKVQVEKHILWLENADGTYTRAEAAVPSDYKEKKLPLVTLAHGFRGTMDSAGGNYLAEALAEGGIATIRMDFSHYTEPRADAKQTNQYTVRTMAADQIQGIAYMIENYNIDRDRVGLYGRSLGGRVAMNMANENAGGYDYKAMALVAPAGTPKAFVYYIGGEEVWKKKWAAAEQNGFVLHQKVVLTPDFFKSIDEYAPSEHGKGFNNPVLIVYNTKDYVVLPETSLQCAAAYANAETIEITSEKSPHGCEMGFKKSEIKDQLIAQITDFFKENL